jgi:hypothetical protein
LILSKPIVAQDYLVDYTFLGSKSKFELLLLFGQAVDYDVDLYRIHYKTPGVNTLPDTASGLMVIPQVPAGTLLPIVVYEHGTTSGPTDVPSQLRGGFEVAMGYAAFGFITLAPDFLGLGDSRPFHPYVHAATEASASLDMLNGCLEYLDINEPEWDPNYLFVAGYSQGGHASMALHKEIEDFWSFVYPITAATHMSGPYSMSGVMRDRILSNESYAFPAYIAYILLGYNEVYHFYPSTDYLFKEPYASYIDSFYHQNYTLTALNNRLIAALAVSGDTVPSKMLQDSILDAFANNLNHPLNLSLVENDTYNWAPSAPTRLYYCDGDNQVPYQNALIAEAAMNSLGATDVQAINQGAGLDHGPCVFPSVISSITFFKTFLHPSALADLDKNAKELSVFPNPAYDEIVIDWDAARGGMDYDIMNTNGQHVSHGRSYFNRISIDHLPAGIYVVLCTAKGETRLTRFVHP